jgi:hypothetical protein
MNLLSAEDRNDLGLRSVDRDGPASSVPCVAMTASVAGPRKWPNAAYCKFGDSMNAKTDREATAPMQAGVLGIGRIGIADQCVYRLVLRPLAPSARDVAARGDLPSCAALG